MCGYTAVSEDGRTCCYEHHKSEYDGVRLFSPPCSETRAIQWHEAIIEDLFVGSLVVELQFVVVALLFFQIILQLLHLLLHRLIVLLQ